MTQGSTLTDSNPDVSPSVWLLLDDRPGHSSQVIGLARYMEWQATAIPLKFNFLNIFPNPLLGGSLLSLKTDCKAALIHDFPSVLVGMGRRTLPVARWIKKQSGSKTKIIMLGRKAIAGPAVIDLLISCVHFRQLPRAGLFALAVPPTKIDAAFLANLRDSAPSPYQATVKRRVLVLVGGPTAQHVFSGPAAANMASALQIAADRIGGELTFLTSRRTPVDAVAAIKRTAPHAPINVWQAANAKNPYLDYLAHADSIVVTGESESMIAEAVASKRPLTIYPLDEKPWRLKHNLAETIYAAATGRGWGSGLARRLLNNGWIVPVRDLDLMHQTLQDRGQATIFGNTIAIAPPRETRELEHLKVRINRLLV